MSPDDSFRILLIHPPFTSPAALPYMPIKIMSALRGLNIFISYHDANLDFFIKSIRDGKTIDEDHPEKGQDDLIDSIKTAWNTLGTENFYLPDLYITSIDSIKKHFSRLFLKSSLSSTSSIKNSKTVMEMKDRKAAFFTEDLNNLVAIYCRNILTERINTFSPQACLISARCPQQEWAAVILSRLGSEICSKMPLIFIGDVSIFNFEGELFNAIISPDDMLSLNSLIRKLGAQPVDPEIFFPNLTSFISGDYAAPSTIFPLPFCEAHDMSVKTASALADERGIRHFIIPYDSGHSDPLAFFESYFPKENNSHFAMETALSREIEKERMTRAYDNGLRLIIWTNQSGLFKPMSRTLWNASEAGIWNHIIVDKDRSDSLNNELIPFIVSNPNIVHSWITDSHPSGLFSDIDENELGASSYSQVKPLPGKPFWKLLSDPAHLFLYIVRFGSETLMKWRIREDLKSIFSIGKNIKFNFKMPQDLPSGYLDEICRMVEAGGSVETQWVRHNLERAFLIAYAEEEGVIVGSSSLKHPRKEYVEALGKQVGFDLSTFLERGYTSVRPEYRGLGIGTMLLEGLTARIGDKKLYSIIAEENLATQKMAIRNRTQKVATFYSQKAGKTVGVWVPDWMIETSGKKDNNHK
ncbi:MAG: GNAT family N-acetyltransferase [Thermodesulfobacteriota bacterium]